MWLYVPRKPPDIDGKITIFGLASGIGMLERAVLLALEYIGQRASVVGYVEREASAAAALVAGMADPALGQAPVWDDLATFDGQPWRGLVDIITAGLPCPAYSTAGKHLGNDDPRAYGPDNSGPVPHTIRIIREVRPALVFFENVPGWVLGGAFQRPGRELSDLGYRILPPLFLASGDLGAPHRRLRVFIMAHADGKRPQSKRCKRTPKWTKSGWSYKQQKMAHTYSRRRPRKRRPKQVTKLPPWNKSCGRVLPLYPPGPENASDWAEIAALDPTRMPAIESGVSVVADGLAFANADLLRIGGNGVDPLVAATAFYVLACRAGFG